MHIKQFRSNEEMRSYLQEMKNAAHIGMHPCQIDISYGDHWVRFVDTDKRVFEFGKVATLIEVGVGEIAAGASADEAVQAVADVQAQMTDSLMYGTAWSPLEKGGTVGVTHKAHVWPIEQTLFEAIRLKGWDIDAIDLADQLRLSTAYTGMRAHVRKSL